MFWASLKEAEEAAQAIAGPALNGAADASTDPVMAHEALMAELTGVPLRTPPL